MRNQEQYVANLDPEIEWRLQGVKSEIPPGSDVSLEGEPNYIIHGWQQHHRTSEEIIWTLRQILPRNNIKVSRRFLLDDYNLGKNNQGEGTDTNPEALYSHAVQLKNFMMVAPSQFCWESDYIEPALRAIEQLDQEGRVVRQNGHVVLVGRRPIVLATTNNGQINPSCAILDSCFQAENPSEIAILVHSREFSHQQTEMRMVNQAIGGGQLTHVFINIFTKRETGSISTILLTTREGETHKLF